MLFACKGCAAIYDSSESACPTCSNPTPPPLQATFSPEQAKAIELLNGGNSLPSVAHATGMSVPEVNRLFCAMKNGQITDEITIASDVPPPVDAVPPAEVRTPDPEPATAPAAEGMAGDPAPAVPAEKKAHPRLRRSQGKPAAPRAKAPPGESPVIGCIAIIVVVALLAFGGHTCSSSGCSSSGSGSTSSLDRRILEKQTKVMRAMGLSPAVRVVWDAKESTLWVGTVYYQGGGSGLIYYWPKTGEWQMQ